MVGFPEEEVRWKSRIKGCKLRSLQATSRYEALQMKSSRTKDSYPGGKGEPLSRETASAQLAPLLGGGTSAHPTRPLIFPDRRTFVSVCGISQLVTVDNAHNC